MKQTLRTLLITGAVLLVATVSYVAAGTVPQVRSTAFQSDCCNDPPPCPDPSNPACPPNGN